MTSFLLLLSLTATTSSVFANDYMINITCNGHEMRDVGGIKLCFVPSISPGEVKYYQLDLLEDHSSIDPHTCEKEAYFFEIKNNKVHVGVWWSCNGVFGIKRKEKGFPYKGGCGQDNFGGFKIVDGYKAKACQFPWMAYINIQWKSKRFYENCGGSIIGDKWILTVAHCFIPRTSEIGALPPSSTVTVKTGSINKYDGFILRRVKRILPYAQFDPKRRTYDIVLLELQKPIKWDGCHAPVCLNTDQNVTASLSLPCRLSGWGATDAESKTRQNDLRWAIDHIMANDECKKIYGDNHNDYTLCGRATSDGNRGPCGGDSGAPLVCKSKQDDRYYQHGVLSLYFSNGRCDTEALYSKVAAFHSWISEHVSNV